MEGAADGLGAFELVGGALGIATLVGVVVKA